MNTVEILSIAGPLGSAVVGILGGAIGGWVSTWANNRAARKRQTTDHDHARALADARVQAETTAALRADRAKLYTDIHEAHADLAAYLTNEWDAIGLNAPERIFSLISSGRKVLAHNPGEKLHERADAVLRRHSELEARVFLLAPRPIREAYLAMHPHLETWRRATATLAAASVRSQDEWESAFEDYNVTIMRMESDVNTYRTLLRHLDDLMRADMMSPTFEA